MRSPFAFLILAFLTACAEPKVVSLTGGGTINGHDTFIVQGVALPRQIWAAKNPGP